MYRIVDIIPQNNKVSKGAFSLGCGLSKTRHKTSSKRLGTKNVFIMIEGLMAMCSKENISAHRDRGTMGMAARAANVSVKIQSGPEGHVGMAQRRRCRGRMYILEASARFACPTQASFVAAVSARCLFSASLVELAVRPSASSAAEIDVPETADWFFCPEMDSESITGSEQDRIGRCGGGLLRSLVG